MPRLIPEIEHELCELDRKGIGPQHRVEALVVVMVEILAVAMAGILVAVMDVILVAVMDGV